MKALQYMIDNDLYEHRCDPWMREPLCSHYKELENVGIQSTYKGHIFTITRHGGVMGHGVSMGSPPSLVICRVKNIIKDLSEVVWGDDKDRDTLMLPPRTTRCGQTDTNLSLVYSSDGLIGMCYGEYKGDDNTITGWGRSLDDAYIDLQTLIEK